MARFMSSAVGAFHDLKNAVSSKTAALCCAGAIALSSAPCVFAEGTATTIEFPSGVDFTGWISQISTKLGTVVAAALGVWAIFFCVRLAKNAVSKNVKV